MPSATRQSHSASQPVAFATSSIRTGADDAALTRMMADHLLRVRPETASEALQRLRQAFPASPLAARVAALTASMRR
jgi:hypothetical protein